MILVMYTLPAQTFAKECPRFLRVRNSKKKKYRSIEVQFDAVKIYSAGPT